MRWDAGDEGRHDDVRGIERWGFGFSADHARSGAVGALVGEIRLASDVVNGRASFVVDLVLSDFGRIVVADEAVPLPRASAGLEIRADGLWASLLCETPFEHWSLGLEAFGLRVDEADRAAAGTWADLVGERLAVGFDLEWELTGSAEPLVEGNGYRQLGTIFGDLLVARDRIAVDAPAWRDHSWGRAVSERGSCLSEEGA